MVMPPLRRAEEIEYDPADDRSDHEPFGIRRFLRAGRVFSSGEECQSQRVHAIKIAARQVVAVPRSPSKISAAPVVQPRSAEQRLQSLPGSKPLVTMRSDCRVL